MNFTLATSIQAKLHHAWLWILHDNDLSFFDRKAQLQALDILETLEKIARRESRRDRGVRRGMRHTCARCGRYVRP